MDPLPEKSPQNIQWWIVSLAISVICCAILFVVFAGYLVNLNTSIAVSNVRLEVIEQRLSRSELDIEELRRRTTVQQIQVVPSGHPVQLPVSVMPGGEQKAPEPAAAPAPAPEAAPAEKPAGQ